MLRNLFFVQVCSDTNPNDFNLDQGFIANAMAPAGTLGQMKDAKGNSIPETGALIGTYCTTNNIGTGGLSDVVSTYTGDFITIAGKLFFKKIISYSSSMIRLNFHNFVAKNLMFCISNSRICIYLFKN